MDNGQAAVSLKDVGIAAGIIAGQIVAIIVVWLIARVLAKRIAVNSGKRIKPLVINKLNLLSVDQIEKVLLFLLRVFKYLLTAFQLFITVPIVFSLFPRTEKLASTIFGYIVTPLKNIGLGIVKYIPNLFTIIIILLITKYLLHSLKFFSGQISRGRLKIPGFYADWAVPTFNILRFIIYAFTVAVVFPYLPGSQSRVFQGISVFVGVIISLGSTSAIGNIVAGLVITYMRPFKIGDRIQIHGHTGFVVEKNLIVLRIKTHKNEYVSIPNVQALTGTIINYNTSSDEDEEGFILNTRITFSYSTPWRLIHEILIEAAGKTSGVLTSPKPFVLQIALDDFYASYQINCYVKDVKRLPAIYSELHANLQDGFSSRGLDMTAPHYEEVRVPPKNRNKVLDLLGKVYDGNEVHDARNETEEKKDAPEA